MLPSPSDDFKEIRGLLLISINIRQGQLIWEVGVKLAQIKRGDLSLRPYSALSAIAGSMCL